MKKVTVTMAGAIILLVIEQLLEMTTISTRRCERSIHKPVNANGSSS